jgi:hypothetical protein
MKDSKKPWLPLWVDSWLFGSARLELSIEQRSVFIDLICLARKDNGFIRANEGIAYPAAQLAGFLCVPESLIVATIDRCIEVGKLERLPDKTLYITSWEKFQLTPRHIRRLGPPHSSHKDKDIERKGKERKAKTDIMSGKTDIPPIPKGLPFKTQEELQTLKDNMRHCEEQLKKRGNDQGAEHYKSELERYLEKYLAILRDFES